MQPYDQMSESVRRVFSAYCAAASPDSREHPHAGKKRIGRKAQRVRRGDVLLRNLSEHSCRARQSSSIETLAGARRIARGLQSKRCRNERHPREHGGASRSDVLNLSQLRTGQEMPPRNRAALTFGPALQGETNLFSPADSRRSGAVKRSSPLFGVSTARGGR